MKWFLINKNEHLGPFSIEIIQQLYSSGEISEESLLWQEGWPEAKPFKSVFSKKGDKFISLDKSSETVKVDNTVDDSVDDSIIIEEHDDELPPELPPEVVNHYSKDESEEIEELEEVEKAAVEKTEAEEFLNFEEEYDFDEKPQRKKNNPKLIAAIFSIVFILFGSWWYYTFKVKTFSRPQNMRMSEFNRLIELSKQSEENNKFAFSLATDKRTLWVGTNIPLEGEVFINFKSKKGKTLGGQVEVKAKGILSQRLITLNDFQFVKGSRFVDGYYDVEIFTVEDLEVPMFLKFFNYENKQLRYIDEFLISAMERKDFENQLQKIALRKQANQNVFWVELKEKYRTVKMITEQIKNGIEKIFVEIAPEEEIDFQGRVTAFENTYKNRYGVFFTEFVKTNEGSYNKLINKQFDDRIEIIGNYSHLSKLAKDIGEESMRVLEDLKSFEAEIASEEEIAQIRARSLVKLNHIMQECERKVGIIGEKL